MDYAERSVGIGDEAVLGRDVLDAVEDVFRGTAYQADRTVTRRLATAGFGPGQVVEEAVEVYDCDRRFIPLLRSCPPDPGLRVETERWGSYEDAVTVEVADEPGYRAAAELLEEQLEPALERHVPGPG